jgi:hypothetical protein
MSRSFKHQPFQAICGGGSAKHDKRLANRGVRRAHRKVLHQMLVEKEYDLLMPHRLECAWNEVYSWGRDGNQIYQELNGMTWEMYLNGHYETWPPQWYVKMMRK